MKTPPSPDTELGLVISLPRPVPDWGAQVLEYVYLLGTTLWMGVQASGVLLIVPILTQRASASGELSVVLVTIFEMLGYVASAAAGLLLLATLGMHVLKLRTASGILVQLILILLMTIVAVVPHLWIVPKLSSFARMLPLHATETGEPSQGHALLMSHLTGLGAMGMLHLIFGALLVGLGTRRCYRYPRAEAQDPPGGVAAGPRD